MRRSNMFGNRENHLPYLTDFDEPVQIVEMLSSFNERSSTGRVVVPPPQSMEPLGLQETGQSWYICRACGRSYMDHERYLEHVEGHDGEDEVPVQGFREYDNSGFNGGQSQFAFSQPYYGYENQDLSSASNPQNTCRICNLSYTRIGTLREHHNNYHNEKNPYPCPHCVCKLITKLSLDRHIRKSHSVEPNPNNKHLKKTLSVKIAHSKLKIAAEFQRKKANPNGIISIGHSVLKLETWKCHICHVVLGSKGALNGHIMRHTGERPFACTECPMKFRHLSNVKRHMDHVHSGQREFSCDHCSCSYDLFVNLLSHIKNEHREIKSLDQVYEKHRKNQPRPQNFEESESQSEIQEEDPLRLSDDEDEFQRQAPLAKKQRINQNQGESEDPDDEESNSLICKVCGKELKSRKILGIHMLIHTGEMPHKCLQCGLKFRTNSNIRMHRNVAHSGGQYKCTKCRCSFHSQNGLKQHNSNIHLPGGRTRILSAKLSNPNSKLSPQHQPQPAIVPKFSKPSITREIRVTDSDNETTTGLACKVCGKVLANRDTMVGHMRIHTGEKPYKCKCGLKFRLSPTLNQHQRVAHSNGKYKCSKCICCYHHVRGLRKHLQDIHNIGVFIQNSKQPVVVRPRKPSGSGTTCKICGKQFTQPHTLKGHMRIHTGEKPYKCIYCGIRFKLNSTLHSHLKTNHAAGEFKCQFCTCSFSSKVSLGAHNKKYHYGKLEHHYHQRQQLQVKAPPKRKQHQAHLGSQEEFLIRGNNKKCPICDKIVSSGSNLRHHLFAHTGERPYQCKHCGEVYRHMANVWRHLKTHNESNHICTAGTCAAISQQIIDKHLEKVKLMTLNRKQNMAVIES